MSLFGKLWWSLALAFGALSVILGLGEYSTLRRALMSNIDRNLELRALWLAHQLQVGNLPEGMMEPPHHSLEELGTVFVEILDLKGKLVRRSTNLEQPIPGDPQPGTYFLTVHTPAGNPLRVHQLEAAGNVGVVRVAESLELAERSLANSVVKILALWALTSLLAALICYRVLRRICQPLEALSLKAHWIAESGEVRERVPVDDSVREVHQVSSTINGLLDRVEKLLSAQERLLQDTSHELRNPLTVLKIDLELLARPELDRETRAEVGQEVQGELSRLIELVEGLMQISWAETSPQIALESLPLEPFLNQLVSRYQSLLGDRNLELRVGPEVVWADRRRLEQILRNLLDNALRYAGSQAQIKVWAGGASDWIPKAYLQPPEDIFVVVEDNGPGIESKYWEKLFERYFRLEPDRNRQAGGVGLGLPLARVLARAMGGELTVYSSSGHGCAFIVRLRPATSDS
ncbi:MAG: HAMP domain-containing histidine kinase [Candidatus Eremiobacteraeota bacterium]|nr:HAMP domain-containing histidine kinase [Candidatus Eremiobacteraeota bacterium]